MKKVQNADKQEKALDELFKRYEKLIPFTVMMRIEKF